MYKKLMVPMDGSELAECVLPHVEAVARAFRAEVEVIRVIEPIVLLTRGGIALTEKEIKQIEMHSKSEAENYLARIIGLLSSKGIKAQSKAIRGKIAESLVDYAKSSGADLIIMATHGRSGISRWFLGSIADRVLRTSHVPVLLIRAPGWAEAS